MNEVVKRRAAVGGAVALFVALAWRFWFTCDDAYITFRYARNLARGYGIRYNVGEPPSEGYSNFLWLLLSAACEGVGLDPATVVNGVSVGCGALLLWRLVALGSALGLSTRAAGSAACALALFPPFAVWGTSGLETMSFALAFFWTAERLAFGAGRAGVASAAVAGVALALSRTEGILWLGVLAPLAVAVRLFAGGSERAVGRAARPVIAALGWMVVPLVAYSVFRFAWFGSLVSNTALVKAHLGLGSLVRGGKYLLLYWATFPLWLPLLAGAWPAVRRLGAPGAYVAVLATAVPVYGVVVGGDFMPMGRLFVAGLPFLYLLLGVAVDALPRWAGVGLAGAVTLGGLLPGAFDLHLVPQSAREALHFRTTDREFLSEYGRWANMKENTEGFFVRGQAIRDYASPGDTLVGQAIGVVGYVSDLHIFDCYGLVTRSVAELPVSEDAAWTHSPGHDKEVPAEHFVSENPTYLHMRVVQGKKAAILIQDSLDRWEVAASVRDRYVPEFVEVEIPGETKRSFLMMIRRVRRGEDAAEMWSTFEEARVALHRELKRDPAADGDAATTDAPSE